MENIELRNKLNKIKKAHGWKNAQLAEHLGVNNSSISKWIHGHWGPNPEAAKKINEMYEAVCNLESMKSDMIDIPPEAPEDLTDIAKNDNRYLEPTSLEQLNPPDLVGINQEPIKNGYSVFLENLRYFMKDSGKWDTDEKLEAYLKLEPGYISEFGNHGDRFTEILVIESICDLLGVPWSVLAFSTVAKEYDRAMKQQKIFELERQLADLKLEVCILNSQLGS